MPNLTNATFRRTKIELVAALVRSFADDVERNDARVSRDQTVTMLRTAAETIDVVASIAWPDGQA